MCKQTKIMAVLGILALVSPASARVITLEVEGVVSHIGTTEGHIALDGSVNIGSVMRGSCIYDTDTPDQYEGDWRGLYEIDAISMTIGNYIFTHDLNSDSPILFKIGTIDYNYVVKTLSPRFDGTVTINGLSKTWDDINWGSSRLTLLDVCSSSNELNLPDTLPEAVPDISIFDWRREFYVYFISDDGSRFYIYGKVASLTVLPAPFEVTPAKVDFHYYVDGPNPEPQMLYIWAKDVDILNWQITEDCNWLDVSPTSGQSSGEIDEVTLTVDISGLAPGSYHCQLAVFDPNVSDYIRYVPVNLFIGSKLLVPSQYLTIQAAIDAARDFDIIIVADGTYTGTGNRDIDFLGKAITVRSENGPNNCTIDCNGTGSAFLFQSGESAHSHVAGFKIINGYHWAGGAIYCRESSPTIGNCIINGNFSGGRGGGGGICCLHGSSPIITNCTITGNSAGHKGGGISCQLSSSPTINNCTITGNSAQYGGGGIYCKDSSPKISNCTITGNSDGGISCRYSSPTITNCIISENSTGYGIYYYFSNSVITNCTIRDNSGGGIDCGHGSLTIINSKISGNNKGGGIECWQNSLKITNCTISGNSADHDGGGIGCEAGSLTINNSTITGNSAELRGGGVNCESATINNSTISNNRGNGIRCHSDAVITNCTIAENQGCGIHIRGILTAANCIITGNSAYHGGGIYCGLNSKVTNCIITGNTAAAWGGGIYCSHNSKITNCTIIGNTARRGGGILCRSDSPAVINCTISSNSAEWGGGIFCTQRSSPKITNCILWDNEAPDGAEMYLGSNANVYVSYTDVQGDQNDVYIGPGSTLDWGKGNIDADPCFVEPGYWADADDPNIIVEPNDPNAIWVDGDYHLLPDSPCIDAGDPNYIPEPNETDLDGNPRVHGDAIDMGAYETIIHEARLLLLPRVINRKSSKPRIMAWVHLPQGITKDQIDSDTAFILYPGGIKTIRQFVFQNRRQGAQRVSIFAVFDKGELMDAIPASGRVELQVLGYLRQPGQYFSGSDTIRIIPRPSKPQPRRLHKLF